jgi:hypothetical protein
MFATSHPRDKTRLDAAQQIRANRHSALKQPEVSLSQSGSSKFFHNTATHFPDLKASSE